MSGYDDRGDRFDRPDRPDAMTGEQLERARLKVSTAGLFLVLNGLVGLILAGALSIPFVFQPEMFPRFIREVASQQPPGAQRQNLEENAEKIEDAVNNHREAYVRQNAAELGFAALTNLLAVLGGLKMRRLRGYGWGMAASVVSLIPLVTGCCCTGIPFGVWGLVVLLNEEVKAAFAATAREAAGGPADGYGP
jgi:hypothetical protein